MEQQRRGRTLDQLDADTEARAVAAVRAALEPLATSGGVRLDATVWLVTARA